MNVRELREKIVAKGGEGTAKQFDAQLNEALVNASVKNFAPLKVVTAEWVGLLSVLDNPAVLARIASLDLEQIAQENPDLGDTTPATAAFTSTEADEDEELAAMLAAEEQTSK